MRNEKERVQHLVNDAERNGEEILQNVQKWLISVNVIIDEVGLFVGDEEKAKRQCLGGLCPDLKIRYQLSKKARKEMMVVTRLLAEGKFDQVSYRIVPENMWLMSNKFYEAFESRMLTLNDILNALSNPNVNTIGVYGIGGVGKTTLVKEAARQAQRHKLFDESTGLCARLKKDNKILIILDDIWSILDLEIIGVPCGDDNKGCKVLLTSRSLDVLSNEMDSQTNYLVGILQAKEAWSLFKKMAGNCVEDRDVQPVAIQVVEECAGLPIAVVTVARALKNKNLYEWKNALRELRRPSSRNFTGSQAVAYSTIELSYNHLESEELKSIFLLCSLLGYTYNGSIRDLLKYGMGLGLFKGISSMEEAQDRVYALIDKLKASCLLWDSYTSEMFSMHDVVRDVAISIASRDQCVFAMKNDEVPREWLDRNTQKKCTAISLHNNDVYELPEGLKYPELKLFYLKTKDPFLKIPDSFFIGMEELKVLDLTTMHLLSLPSSLHLLLNLQTLCLDQGVLGDIAIIGELKKLEILSFYGSYIEQLPIELGQLTRLRLLDLSDCSKLKVIPPNVLSNLSQLEELYMGNSFVQWEVEGLNDERRNASLDELKHLPHLTTLEMHIPSAKILPKRLFSKKLARYRISIGDGWDWSGKLRTVKVGNCDKLKNIFSFSIARGLPELQVTEVIECKNMEEIFAIGSDDDINNNEVNDKIVFGKLRTLILRSLPRLASFCSISGKRRKVLTTCTQSNEIILENAIDIPPMPLLNEKIEKCPEMKAFISTNISSDITAGKDVEKMNSVENQGSEIRPFFDVKSLKYLFPASIARSLLLLEELYVENCRVEEIVGKEESEATARFVLFPELIFLKLWTLPELRAFYPGAHTLEWPVLKKLAVYHCDIIKIIAPEFLSFQDINTENQLDILAKQPIFLFDKVFPNLEELTLSRKDMTVIWQGQFHKLKVLQVVQDESSDFPLDFLQCFRNLEELVMRYCSYKEIFLHGDIEKHAGILAKIKVLKFDALSELKCIWKQDSKLDSALRNVEILHEEGNFDKVSYCTVPEKMWLTSVKGYEAFESRISTLKDILNALSSPDVKLIGVYGLGGVGKTTLRKEVARQAKRDKIFDVVVFAVVSQTPDIRRIKGEIADDLGLRFFEESESGRARRLCARLKKEKKILVVLDDIWMCLDLEMVGIPFGDDAEGCKILLTSRSRDVLSTINVSKECACLPIAIVTLAKALRNKSLFEWKNVLRELRSPSSRNFEGMQAVLYSTIELSYNYLDSKELKSTFLLCSLIGDGYSAFIPDLLKHGIGLGLFKGIGTIEGA
ncbi:hypothetical protein EZV62_006978 [Acer yangbiense]|uniref:AAA+ ATPase domain-containing protein n=1 Tax=Acer yangbiense TaxID=1000413 RepID=A0A5C7I800_9ROSI|nr:hypothetical protein EZV62_006978 [Acer yangbiense]